MIGRPKVGVVSSIVAEFGKQFKPFIVKHNLHCGITKHREPGNDHATHRSCVCVTALRTFHETTEQGEDREKKGRRDRTFQCAPVLLCGRTVRVKCRRDSTIALAQVSWPKGPWKAWNKPALVMLLEISVLHVST